jgi:hypothetical protein
MPIKVSSPISPVLPVVAVNDVYSEIEAMYEGIDQQEIITNFHYESVDIVKEDTLRMERMKLTYTLAELVVLPIDPLAAQFRDNQAKYMKPELVTHMNGNIMGKIHSIKK